MEREKAAVSEKHLLLARNLTSALDRYAEDTKAVFEFMTAAADRRQPAGAEIELARKIGIEHFSFVDSRGQVLTRAVFSENDRLLLPENIAALLDSQTSRTAAFSRVMRDRNGSPRLYLTQRLTDGRTAIAAISSNFIRTIQRSIAFGKKGHSVVVDHVGNVIAHPRQDWERQIKNISSVEPITESLAGRTGVMTFVAPAFNIEMITGFTAVQSTGWGVMVPQPMQELQERTVQVRHMVIGLIIIGLVAAGLIAWFLSGLLARPVSAVVQAAQDFAKGNLDTRVPSYSSAAPVEYRELGSAFNAMAHDVARDITERKKIEEALRLSEAQLGSIINNSPSPISLKDRGGRFVLVNTAFEETFDVKNEEIAGQIASGFVPDALSREISQTEQLVFDTGEPQFAEREVKRPDGRLLQYIVTKFPINGADGVIVGLGTIMTDIGTLRRADAELRESRRQLRLVIDSLPVLIAQLDEDMRFEIINKTGASWYNLPIQQIIGTTPQDVFGNTTGPWQESMRKALAGEVTTYTGPVPYPDGVTREVQAIYVPNIDLQDKVRGFFTLVEDVTERNRTVESLRRHEEELRLLLDAVPARIMHIDRELRYATVNKLTEEWLARPESEIVGTPIADILGEEAFEEVRPSLEAALAGERVEFSNRIDYPDGKTRDIEVSFSPYRNADGKIEGISSLTLDVTRRRRLEEQLRQAQKMEVLGKVAGGVAHEFNNMLMAITGSLELLIDEDLRDLPEARRKVERTLMAVFKGKSLTGRLLSYTGNPFHRPQVMEFSRAIKNSIESCTPALGEKCEIETAVAPDIWSAKLDPGEFSEALTNLLLNARDALPDGGRIRVTAENLTLDRPEVPDGIHAQVVGDYVRVSVTDNGIGMSPDIVANVFDPFFTTKDIGQGTGLGLSMVYGFVHRQSGGFVDIQSAPGAGTTVSLYLPRYIPDVPEPSDAMTRTGCAA